MTAIAATLPAHRTKKCAWCGPTVGPKPLSDFGRRRSSPDGRQSVCKKCLAENWRKNHNIDEAPPIPRKSPYDIFGDKLDELECLVNTPGTRRRGIVAAIEEIRLDLKI